MTEVTSQIPVKNTIDKPDNCPICFESLGGQQTPTICFHWFHTHCLDKGNVKICPLCRRDLITGKEQEVAKRTFTQAELDEITDQIELNDTADTVEHDDWIRMINPSRVRASYEIDYLPRRMEEEYEEEDTDSREIDYPEDPESSEESEDY